MNGVVCPPLPFLRDLHRQLRCSGAGVRLLEYRMDGAFFRSEIVDLLERQEAEHAIKVLFYPWLHLNPLVASRRRWKKVSKTVSYFETKRWIGTWERTVRIVIYRKKVRHKTKKWA